MNQDQVKSALIGLRPTKADFTLIFSGKKSSRVNGLYKPATREIVIHNRNFESDNDLLFTALHEYAHHLDCTEAAGRVSARAHTVRFWATFHGLLGQAEASGLYRNPARGESFAATTDKLQALVAESGRIMQELGRLLIEAQGLCAREGARFDDYVMRTLKLTMPFAAAAMKAVAQGLPAELGAEGMKTVSAIKDPDARAAATAALTGDESPMQVRQGKQDGREPEDIEERLQLEKTRIEKTVQRLLARESEIEKRLDEIRGAA